MDKKIVIEAQKEIQEIDARTAKDLEKRRVLAEVVRLYGGESNGRQPETKRVELAGKPKDAVTYLAAVDKLVKGPDIAKAIEYAGKSPFSQVMADLKKAGKVKFQKLNNNNLLTYWGLAEWFDGEVPKTKYKIQE